MKLKVAIPIASAIALLAGFMLAFWGTVTLNWILLNATLTAGAMTIIVLIVGLLLANVQLKDMAKDRHAQILLTISRDWRSEQMQKSRATIASAVLIGKVVDPNKSEAALVADAITAAYEKNVKRYAEMAAVAEYFEDVGLMVGKKFIHPPDLVLELLASPIIRYWELFTEMKDRWNKKDEREDILEWFGYMYGLSKAYTEAKRATKEPPEKRPRASQLFERLADYFR